VVVKVSVRRKYKIDVVIPGHVTVLVFLYPEQKLTIKYKNKVVVPGLYMGDIFFAESRKRYFFICIW